MPLNVSPSAVFTVSISAPAGTGPALGTARMGKISSSWKSNMVMAPAEIAASAAMMGRILARESRIDRRRNPVNRVRLFDYWRVIELGGRRVDMPAGCDHERDVLRAK